MSRYWIVVNGFLHSGKFSELALWLQEAAARRGISLDCRQNSEIPVWTDRSEWEEKPEWVIFWDKDVRLAFWLEQQGVKVYNGSRAIGLCDDKAMTHMLLAGAGIPQPETMIAPMTYDTVGYTDYRFLEEAEERLGYPMVIKECFGSFGQQVYLAENREELLAVVKRIGTKPMLFQQFIGSSRGRDVRIQVVGDRAVASMYRYSDRGDFRANITNGGKMKAYEPDEAQLRLALRAAEVLGVDFAGVDLLFGRDGEPLVCEVNSNAHFKNIYDCTGINAAEEIIDYILKKQEK